MVSRSIGTEIAVAVAVEVRVGISAQLLTRRSNLTIRGAGDPVTQAVGACQASRIGKIDRPSISGILFGFR
jgi:hypothetical protein